MEKAQKDYETSDESSSEGEESAIQTGQCDASGVKLGAGGQSKTEIKAFVKAKYRAAYNELMNDPKFKRIKISVRISALYQAGGDLDKAREFLGGGKKK